MPCPASVHRLPRRRRALSLNQPFPSPARSDPVLPPAGNVRPGLAGLVPNLARHAWLKGLGLTAGMTLFFIAYFGVLHHPQFPVTTVPMLALDRWIPFQPVWLLAYASLWVYVSLLPGVMGGKRELMRYATAATGLAVAGLAFFVFFPTTIETPDIDWSRHPSVSFLKTVDASGNACPSLHVAFAVFTAYGLHQRLRWSGAGAFVRAVNAAWAAAIVYSTLAVKQHVTLDVAAGTLLGAAAAWVWRALDRGDSRPPGARSQLPRVGSVP